MITCTLNQWHLPMINLTLTIRIQRYSKIITRWLRDEQRYRIDGPATVQQSGDGYKEYFYYDELFSHLVVPNND